MIYVFWKVTNSKTILNSEIIFDVPRQKEIIKEQIEGLESIILGQRIQRND